VKRRAAGVIVADIASELGLARGTVMKWSVGVRATRAMVPVEVVAEPSSERTVSIVSPSGFRIEGLSLLEAAALLRAVRSFSARAAPLACSRTHCPWTCARATTALFGLVKTGLGRDPRSGELFLFVNKRRAGCKVLVWDSTGLCIFQKRLERGRLFALLNTAKSCFRGRCRRPRIRRRSRRGSASRY
jgi:hypothetical protein